MTSTAECDLLAENMGSYVDGSISMNDARRIDAHLSGCNACQESLHQFRAVKGLIEYMEAAPATAALQPAGAPAIPAAQAASFGMSLYERFSSVPWWMVSAAMHVLIIALASLLSMAIEAPRNDDSVIMVTELKPPAVMNNEEPEKVKKDLDAIMAQKTPPTDLQSKEFSDIVVPPDILARAELGDHFETVNPDREDTHSAYGNIDSKSFHSMEGNAEAAGGGGTGGLGMDDLIGYGGAASQGKGGGFGGGDGTGIGTGNGAGKGSFGNRTGGGRKLMVKRGGGSPATEGAVEKALEWLARNQEQDGHWDAKKLEGTCSEQNWADVGMTGIATLAFLGAGNSEKVGKYKDNVGRAVYWLLDKQIKKEGKDKGSWVTVMYANGLATMALAEAYGMGSRNADMKTAVQDAVNYIQDAQHQYMAWNYYADKSEGARNDTSVSGWQVMALKDAKVCGFKVDTLAFEGVMNWLNCGQDLPKDAADSSYDFEGGMMAYGGVKGALEGKSLSMTAAVAMMRIFLGQKMDHPGIVGPCNLMKREKCVGGGPIWVPCTDPYPPACPGKGIDFYYWYYGTFAMFQMGGEHWKIWNQHLKDTLLPLQRKDGAADGSWDPIGGGRIPDGGRVFSTALGALCLEVYYRYAKMAHD